MSPCSRQRGCLPLFLLCWLEIQRGRIHAVSQARGCRTVLKHMPQVRVAFRAADFRPYHAVLRIPVLDYSTFGSRLIETWPARAGIKLRLRVKERSSAADAVIDTRLLVVPVSPGKSTL